MNAHQEHRQQALDRLLKIAIGNSGQAPPSSPISSWPGTMPRKTAAGIDPVDLWSVDAVIADDAVDWGERQKLETVLETEG
jgi:hypothetical protein